MAIPHGDTLRRNCINLRRMINDRKSKLTTAKDLAAQIEREINDIERQRQDPNVDEWLKKEIEKDLPKLSAQLSSAEAEIQRLKQEIDDLEIHYSIDCSAF